MNRSRPQAAFTLIELIVVMAIVSLLVTVAFPRYLNSVERSKEAALKQDLYVMRDAIDKFYSDVGSYPRSLEELVDKRYLRRIPADPFTDRTDTWRAKAPPENPDLTVIYDVASGAEGTAADGTRYAEW